jgi:hypothetical protein
VGGGAVLSGTVDLDEAATVDVGDEESRGEGLADKASCWFDTSGAP